VLDIGSDDDTEAGGDAGHQTDVDGESLGVVDVIHQPAADDRSSDVVDNANDGPAEQAAGHTRTARGRIVGGRVHAMAVCKDLSDSDEAAEGQREAQPKDAVEAGGEPKSRMALNDASQGRG
jgi:hypothetical protein